MMKAININWDTDEDIAIVLPVSIEIPEDITDEEEISDFLSNITGYCHKGFDLIKEIEPTKKELTRIECIDYICENINKIKKLIESLSNNEIKITIDIKNDSTEQTNYRVYKKVKDKFRAFSCEHPEHKVQDLMSQALEEFVNKYN